VIGFKQKNEKKLNLTLGFLLFILGGPLLVRAAWYTAGAVGGEIGHFFC